MSDREPGARLPMTVDPSLARLSRWFRWFVLATMTIPYVVVLAAYGVVLWGFGLAPAIVMLVGGYLLVAAPIFDIHIEGTLATERTHDQVRQDVRALVNPFTALWLPWADSVREPPADSEARAVVRFSTLRVFTREAPLFTKSLEDDRLRIQLGREDTPLLVTDLLIRRTPGGTEVAVSSDIDQHRPRRVLRNFLQRPFERRLLTHFGYRLKEGELVLDLRLPW